VCVGSFDLGLLTDHGQLEVDRPTPSSVDQSTSFSVWTEGIWCDENRASRGVLIILARASDAQMHERARATTAARAYLQRKGARRSATSA